MEHFGRFLRLRAALGVGVLIATATVAGVTASPASASLCASGGHA